MNSIQSQKIGLCIAGTKSRQGGFTPFVIAGILAGNEASNMDRVTLVVEKPVYVIKHTNEYILYLLIDRKVKPCDRDTFGVLSIALTIARDMRLADGKSPYTLLKEVYDKFRSDYMESDGNECDRFINKDVNSADFISIMEQYPVEKRSFDDYVTMNPSGLAGTLCVPQEKMADLFRDSQYSEFAQFKEVEIGARCLTTPGLEHLEIPRPVVYSIKVGERIIKETMSRPDDFFDTASILRNTSDIMYDNLSFCLEDLLNAPEHKIQSGQSSVTLDMEGRCIRCEIQKKEIKYSLEYQIEGGTEKERRELGYLLLDKKIKLIIGGNAIEFSSSSPKKNYVPASWSHQTVSYKAEQMVTFGFRVTSTVDDEKKHVMVTITIDTPKRDTYSGTSFGYQGRSFGLNVPATTQTYSGEGIEGDHEEDWDKLRSSNEQPSQKQPSNKAKKRWILLGVCCLVSMCIGSGIVGTVWYFNRGHKLTREDSIRITQKVLDNILPEYIFTKELLDTNQAISKWFENYININKGANVINDTVVSDLGAGQVNIGTASGDQNGGSGAVPAAETEQPANVTASSGSSNNEKVANDVRTKEEIRNEVLKLIKRKGEDQQEYNNVLKKCRNIWDSKEIYKTYFTEQELNAIEAILDWDRYKDLSTAAKERITQQITKQLSTYKQIKEVSDKITDIKNNDLNNKNRNN